MVQKKPNGPIGVVMERIFGIPVDRNILFANHKGVYKKGIEKRQRKLIIKIPFIKPFLDSDERVLMITTGYSPLTSFEKYIIGWFFIYLKRSLFIFTDKRLFHVPTTPIFSYRHIISQIIFKHCRSISVNGGKLVVQYLKLGKTERFIGLAGKEKKRVNMLLKKIEFGRQQKGTAHRTNLCPQCTTILNLRQNKCVACKLNFKTSFMGNLLTLLVPGGGYFYVRQYFLGFLSAIIEILLIGALVLLVTDISNGISAGYLWLITAFIAFTAIKFFSIFHVSTFISEIIPQKKSVTA